MKRYIATEHLETALDDHDPQLGFAKYECVAQCVEDGCTSDFEIVGIDNVYVFDTDGVEVKLSPERLAEVEKWLEQDAIQYISESRLVHWSEVTGQ
jgi:hypothetical protein